MNSPNYYHKNLAQGRWFTLTFFEQMANIGGEVERAIKWRRKNHEYYHLACDRALELADLTIADKRNHHRPRLKELARLREAIADYFYFDNIYGSTDQKWRNYFGAFAYAARIRD